jgi:myo-inositol 2-dehydrogenase / D-chiro-inositol 1-dehydrogenase
MTIRVGLIGCGFIGAFHSKAIRGLIKAGLIDARYEAVCDVDVERAERFAALAGVERWTSDPLEVIESADIDAVYVCTQTARHLPLVVAAAEAGKAIFCEKPLATSLPDVQAMVNAVARAGVPSQVGLVLRHSPIFVVLKELAAEERLGRLMSVIFRDDQYFPITGQYASQWRGDYAQAGGGTLIEHSIHDLDMLLFLCGKVGSVRGLTRYFYEHDRVEDLCQATLEFESGAIGTLTSIWHGIDSRSTNRHLELFFENGTFWVDQDFLGPIYYQTNERGEGVIEETEVRRRYREIVRLEGDVYEAALLRWSFEDYFFFKALESGTVPYPGFDIALEAHVLADAIYRSAAASGEEVTTAGAFLGLAWIDDLRGLDSHSCR